MLNYLLTLFTFEHWANAQLFEALGCLESVPLRSQQLCAHLMSAHEFMDLRLHERPANFWEYDFFPHHSLDMCRALNDRFGATWPEYLRALPEPLEQQTVAFKDKEGQPSRANVVDVLTHLHTHSMYHRGQIAMDLRAAGLPAVATDFISFRRATR
jgi:uncharacterized damage-inducible protein DinB